MKKHLTGLVTELPARFTRIVANIAKLQDVANFYGILCGDSCDGEGKETFTGSVGLLRYLIAHGDTTVEAYEACLRGEDTNSASL